MKILFISHEATLTGAPIMLFRLLEWIHTNRKDITCTVLLGCGGALENKFVPLSDNVIVWNAVEKYSIRLPYRLRAALRKRRQKKILQQIKKKGFDLIYSNTIVNGALLARIKKSLHVPTIVHVHEMIMTIEETGQQNIINNFSNCDHIIATSGLVASQTKTLLQKNGFDKNIDVVNPFIPIRDTPRLIQKDSSVVGGCGSFAWRKGVEYFIFIAHEIKKLKGDVIFQWVGGDHSSEEFKRFSFLISRFGLTDSFTFIKPTADPLAAFINFDVFFLSSFEEPFSMAAAECAMLRIPVVCIKDCTGIEELLVPNGAWSFDFGDHTGIVNGIIELLNNDSLRERIGEQGSAIVSNNLTADINAPKIVQVMEKVAQI